MRRPIVAVLVLTLISASVRAENFAGAPPPGNWNKVQSLAPGANLTIELTHKQEIECEFMRLDEYAIVIRSMGRERVYPKSSVARIKLMHPGSRARNAAVVGGIFFGAGFGLGYAAAPSAADQSTMPSGERAQIGAGMGAIIGGIAAAISLAHHPGARGEVIYRVRQ